MALKPLLCENKLHIWITVNLIDCSFKLIKVLIPHLNYLWILLYVLLFLS